MIAFLRGVVRGALDVAWLSEQPQVPAWLDDCLPAFGRLKHNRMRSRLFRKKRAGCNHDGSDRSNSKRLTKPS